MKRFGPIVFFGGARSWQALLEAIVACFVYLLVCLRLTSILSWNSITIALILMNPLAAVWCAARIRFIPGAKLKKILRELLLPIFLEVGFLLLLVLPLFLAAGSTLDVLDRYSGNGARLSLFLIVFLIPLVYFLFRLAIWGLRFWQRFQRRSLVLSLTNAILTVAFLAWILLEGVLFLLGLLFGNGSGGSVTSGGSLWLETFFSVLLPILVGSSFMMFLVVAIVLPFAGLFSYWVARRTARRVSELARATDRMRAGRLETRVPVEGEDEVARLQAGFNTMAENLERTLKQLAAERDRVQGLLHSRRELIVGISHDLRTPVATIRALVESQQAKAASSAIEPAGIATMEREVIRLQALIDELFRVSQAEVDRLTVEARPTEVGLLVRQRVEAVAPLAWQSGRVHVSADIPANLPLALADSARLEQALTNLLHNAVRYTPPGGVVVASAEAEESRVTLTVRDTGDGIHPDDLPHIWERYYRGKHSPEEEGAGVGLALVKEYIEAMGGSVQVESALGKGSAFSIRLLGA